MQDKMEERIKGIKERTLQKKIKREKWILSGLSGCSLFMLAGVFGCLQQIRVCGCPMVTLGYGSVLLRERTSSYVVAAVAAFICGAALTIGCIRYKQRQWEKDRSEKGSQENLK